MGRSDFPSIRGPTFCIGINKTVYVWIKKPKIRAARLEGLSYFFVRLLSFSGRPIVAMQRRQACNAKTSQRRRLVVLCAAAIACILCFGTHHVYNFSKIYQQESLSKARERLGKATRSRVTSALSQIKLTKEESVLLKRISQASEKRNWPGVKRLFESYSGDAVPLYHAAMHAAFRCREYEDGAKLYSQCRQSCSYCQEPVLVTGMKIYGKLGQPNKVEEIWHEALSKKMVNRIVAAARIDAAADDGDVEKAATVLDYMQNNSLEIGLLHINSAVRSCWGMGKNSAAAARYFFDLLPEMGLRPDLVSFTTLIGAYRRASLDDILLAYQEMKSSGIKPSRVFAETCIITVLQFDKTKYYGEPKQIATSLQGTSPARLKAAKDAFADFKFAGIELSRLCTKVEKALRLTKL